MVGIFTLVTGLRGPSGFGLTSTAEEVKKAVNVSNITAIITGMFCVCFVCILGMQVNKLTHRRSKCGDGQSSSTSWCSCYHCNEELESCRGGGEIDSG
ncbi:hypothetical protein ZOSMA_6G01690 [Zostera marina]|uniref:Uncharacterized protein n=1 Tax=Zostera marina TaxID=29655 RepID=A0A0K9NTG7_ZOSMR|nr:hypothetical protein ZOSMA_6G01690 [Zostera marina]